MQVKFRRVKTLKVLWGLLISISVTGCVAPQDYQSQAVASRALMSRPFLENIEYQGVLRNPVIVVHGLLGSRLTNVRTGKNIWGDFSTRKISDPEEWQQLALPDKSEERQAVLPHGLLDFSTLKLLGMKFSLTNYESLIQVLEKLGYVRFDRPLPAGKDFPSLFLFDYDWRRSVPENVVELERFILSCRQMLQTRYEALYGVKNYDVRFDVIAHSMGGLLTRYYLQYGAQPLPEQGTPLLRRPQSPHYLEKVFMVGTPNAGYLDTVLELVNGLSLMSVAPAYPPALLGTFGSYYCMLPQPGTCQITVKGEPKELVDIFDSHVWIAHGWGLADPQQDKVLEKLWPQLTTPSARRKAAIDLLCRQLKMGKQFNLAMRRPLPPSREIFLMLFAGDAFETNFAAEVDPVSGDLLPCGQSAGDGKILSSAARFDARTWPGVKGHFYISPIPWNGIIHLGASHMGLFNSTQFYSNLGFYLLSYPTARQLKLRDLPRRVAL